MNFDEKIKEMYEVNTRNVLDELKTKQMQEKIHNFAKMHGLHPKYVEQLILDDYLYRINFAKDPTKQTAHEKIVAEHIKSALGETGVFKKLPSGGKSAKYVTSNGVRYENLNGTKSIDFEIHTKGLVIYATCKYTKGNGGAQDNQYNDVKKYIKVCAEMVSSRKHKDNERFIAIVDGSYYTKEKLSELTSLALGTVDIISASDFKSYLDSLS